MYTEHSYILFKAIYIYTAPNYRCLNIPIYIYVYIGKKRVSYHMDLHIL